MTDKPVIFVTGGTSEIGLAIVEAILAEGWHAMIADSAGSHLELAKKRFGDKITCGHTDVTCENEVRRAIDMCESECGPVSGVVNSAGIGRSVSALDTDIDLFRNMLAVNLLGGFLVARRAAKKMSERGCGSIVNITSASGIRGNAGRSAYGASKGGVIAMTNVLAVEWAEFASRVNAIAPGPVDTPLTLKAHSARDRSTWTAAIPLGRYGAPSEIAAAAIFLLDGQKPSYITGQTLCVDGGFTTAGILPSKQSVGRTLCRVRSMNSWCGLTSRRCVRNLQRLSRISENSTTPLRRASAFRMTLTSLPITSTGSSVNRSTFAYVRQAA